MYKFFIPKQAKFEETRQEKTFEKIIMSKTMQQFEKELERRRRNKQFLQALELEE